MIIMYFFNAFPSRFYLKVLYHNLAHPCFNMIPQGKAPIPNDRPPDGIAVSMVEY